MSPRVLSLTDGRCLDVNAPPTPPPCHLTHSKTVWLLVFFCCVGRHRMDHEGMGNMGGWCVLSLQNRTGRAGWLPVARAAHRIGARMVPSCPPPPHQGSP